MNQSNTLQIIELLNQVTDLLINQKQIKHKKAIRLLRDTEPHIVRLIKNSQENALKFNVFSALGVTRKEIIQSRFLAFLLDPDEQHCQGPLFLNTFLAKIGLPSLIPDQSKAIQVTTEHFAGESLGRMDIVLNYPSNWLVAVENKVDADEGQQQLERYAKWLNQQRGYKQQPLLIFLTPTGHESVTVKANHYLQLSYLELAEAFAPLLNEIKADSVRTVVAQYITTCKLIGGMDVATQDKELLELLTKPENIKVALEIEQQTRFIRSQVIKEFGEHIKEILQRKLITTKIEAMWKAESVFFNENTLNIEIKTLKHQIKNNYKMLAERVFFKSRDGWSGWYRPRWIEFKNQSSDKLDTKYLTEKMIKDGYRGAEGWWVGWNYLREGKKSFVSTDIDDIVACLEDNHTENHPLAFAIADELWSMFITYYKDIEALESFKQAASDD